MTTIRLYTSDLPQQLTGWASVNRFSLPRFWATVWDAIHGANLAQSTAGARLTSIDRFYKHVEEFTGSDCLDQILHAADINKLEPLLEGYFSRIRNETFRTKTDRGTDWSVAFHFVRDVIDRQGQILKADNLDIFKGRMERLNRLYATLSPPRPVKRKIVRALPASVIENLYELVDPESATNPFRSDDQRYRNHSLFLLFLHQGLRRGEALILPVNAIKSEISRETGRLVSWINVVEHLDGSDDDERDIRRNAPNIKTEQSRRQIPIADDLVKIISHYTDNYRGKQNHSFLFPSNRDIPLAIRSVNALFHVLSENLSEGAKKDLQNRLREAVVRPHDLRHTCAVHRLSQYKDAGCEMDLALQLLRSFFGWSRTSDMPQHYAAAYFEDRLKTVWQQNFDDRTAIIRNLKSLDGHLRVVASDE